MRLLVLAGVLFASPAATADCLGVSFNPGPTVRGTISRIEWGAPVVATCPDGQARCFAATLAMSGEPTHVRIVLEKAEHRTRRGGRYKLKRLVLDGVLPRRSTECVAAIEKWQVRELEVEPRTSAPWRITTLR